MITATYNFFKKKFFLLLLPLMEVQMNKEQIEMFKKLLLEQKSYQIALKDESIAGEKLPDAIDAAIDDIEKSLTTKFISRKAAFIKKIDNALNRLDKGTYGECESCGAEIGVKRLMARLTASLCIECKQEQEDQERKEKERMKGGFLEEWS